MTVIAVSRPRNPFTSVMEWAISKVPPAPASPAEVSWRDVKAAVRPWYALPPLLFVGVLVATYHYLPYWAAHSPVWIVGDVALALFGKVAGTVIGSGLYALCVHRVAASVGRTEGGLAGAALREEQMFREGAETWSWAARLRTALLFGGVHLVNLYVPLVAVPFLAGGGLWFMAVYLRAMRTTGDRAVAVTRAAAVHYAHNMTVFAVAALGVVGLLVAQVV